MTLGDKIFHKVIEDNFIDYIAGLRRDTTASQVHVPEYKEAAEIVDTWGLMQAGEGRFGNGNEPGEGFTGVRIGFPGWSYRDLTWLIASVVNDELAFGVAEGTDGIFVGDDIANLQYDSTNGLRVKGDIVVSGIYPYGFDVFGEEIEGEFDGTLASLSTQTRFTENSLHVTQNGLWLDPAFDYDEQNVNDIWMVEPVQSTDSLRANYVKESDRLAIYNETPGGAYDGVTRQHTLANDALGESVQLFLNGASLLRVADYVSRLAGFTMGDISAYYPEAGDRILAYYLVEDDSDLVKHETLTGTIDGSNTVFTFANDYVSGAQLVVLNGLRQVLTDDYTETDTDEITFVEAPQTGDKLWATYRKA
jgi:hypothetical protein